MTQYLEMKAFSPPPNLSELRMGLPGLPAQAYRALDFKGIPQLESFSRELLLEEVYVPLAARAELPAGRPGSAAWPGAVGHGDLPDEPWPPGQRAPAAGPGGGGGGTNSPGGGAGRPRLGQDHAAQIPGAAPGPGKRAPLPILLPLNAYAAALAQRGRYQPAGLLDRSISPAGRRALPTWGRCSRAPSQAGRR